MTRAILIALILPSFLDDDDIDPTQYKGPAEAKAVSIKVAAAPAARAYFGISGGESSEDGGVVLSDVPEDGPAGQAGLERGDRVMAFGDEEIKDYNALVAMIRAQKPGATVTVRFERDGEEKDVAVTLGTRAAGGDWGLSFWTRPTFRLAVVLIEFPEGRHNPSFKPDGFERMLFSRGQYTSTSPSGEEAHGSLADYYAENSYGTFTVTGKCFDWVTVEETRGWFEEKRMGDRAASNALFDKAIRLIEAREGADCFAAFDGIVFIYAGRQTYKRPWLLWPHRASIKVGKRTFPYYLNAEGGKYFNAVGVHVHEFGHMLGLPDQYGRHHATGVGKWCTMAIGHMGGGSSRNGRPYHLCVWCKERLGWVKPVAIDPREPQRLKLSAIEKDGTQVFKILLKADGTQCYYLENRQRLGFDTELEGAGLLVWHQARSGFGSIDLIEAHGRPAPNASLVELEEVPFPSLYNRHFTPETTPASVGEVRVTDIVEKEGVIYFTIGIKKEAATKSVDRRGDY